MRKALFCGVDRVPTGSGWAGCFCHRRKGPRPRSGGMTARKRRLLLTPAPLYGRTENCCNLNEVLVLDELERRRVVVTCKWEIPA